jgi:hypothetical protein
MFYHKSIIAELYSKKNNLAVKQLEKSMLRHTGKDGDFFTLFTNIAYVVFRGWLNLIVALAAIGSIIFGSVVGATQYVVLGGAVLLICFLGFCSFFYFEWKNDRMDDTKEIWVAFKKHLATFSEVTFISEEVICNLSEAELREIATQKLQQIAEKIKENDSNPVLKNSLRDEFKRIHSALYLLGLAEGAWGKYFAH